MTEYNQIRIKKLIIRLSVLLIAAMLIFPNANSSVCGTVFLARHSQHQTQIHR